MNPVFRIGLDILTTTVDKVTRKILAQTGALQGTNDDGTFRAITDSDNVEWWQHYGFASRPPRPTKGKEATQAIVIPQGDHDVAIASQDMRGLDLYGELDHGEVCLYSAGDDGKGQGRILLKKDGAVAMYTIQGNAKGGPSCTIQLLPTGGINIASPFGGLAIADGKATFLSAAGSGMQCDANGVALIGTTVIANGSVVLGDATATGVATQLSMAPLMTALTALTTTLTAMLSPTNALAASIDPSGALGSAVGAAATAVSVTANLPTTFSLKVKAA